MKIEQEGFYWEAHTLLKKETKDSGLKTLFEINTRQYCLPELHQNLLEDAYDEIELLGFPVSLSLFDMLQTSYRGSVMTDKLCENFGKTVKMCGLLNTIKYVRTVRSELMTFGTFVDQTGEFFDVVNFPDNLKIYPYRGSGIYLILGKVVKEFGVFSIEVEKMAKLPLKTDPRSE